MLLHKSDAGAILLNVADEAALRRGFKRVLTNAWAAVPADSVNGVLVQEMIPSGTEVIVGMSRDPQFGPVIACGLGGIFVETLKDVQLLVPPLTETEIRQALTAAARLPDLARQPGCRGRRGAAFLGAVSGPRGDRPGDRRQSADRDGRFGLRGGLLDRADDVRYPPPPNPSPVRGRGEKLRSSNSFDVMDRHARLNLKCWSGIPVTPLLERYGRGQQRGELRRRQIDGLLFRRQHPIGPYIVDFVCHSARLVVEIDGSVHDQQQEYDAERDDYLQQLGYTVLRCSVDRVLNDIDGVLSEIRAACTSPPLPRTGEGAGGGGFPRRERACPGEGDSLDVSEHN